MVQLLAAASAAGLVQTSLTPGVANSKAARLGATAVRLTDAGLNPVVLALELIVTFVLMISILAGTIDPWAHKLGGITISITIFALICSIGRLTGTSMNVVRTVGPAACSSRWDMHRVYSVAPVLGAGLAAFDCLRVRKRSEL